MTPPPPRRRAGGAVRIALVLGAVAVALLIAEGLTRLLGLGPQFGQLILVRDVPTRVVDGVALWNSSEPRATEGDVARAAAKADAFTILGLGDSIMYGVRQRKADTYLERTRAALAERASRPVEVINLAVPGFNSVQEETVYREVGDRLAPDLVLVHYWVDDVHQYRVVAGYVVDFGNVSDDGHFVVRALPLPDKLSDWLLVHSRLYDLLTQAVVALRGSPTSDDWSRVSAPLTRIRERASRGGGRMVVLASPDMTGEAPRPNGDLARLRALGADVGFEVIDLTEWLPGTKSRDISIDPYHFNAEGHRLIAERLTQYLLARDLHS